jgi:hypothetical protein
VTFNGDEQQTLTNLFSNIGWSLVTGPKLSGKTYRLLHCAHHYPKDDKDLVWFNFDGITSEVDGISRVSQLLHFRNCHIYLELEVLLHRFLSKLRFGSIVIFDNIRLLQQRLAGIGTACLSMQDVDKQNQQKIVYFFKRLFSTCKIHSKSLAFVVVTDSVLLLDDAVDFDVRVSVGPLSDAAADDMIAAIKHTVVSTSLYFATF